MAIQIVWELFCRVEETVGVARVEEHRAEARMLEQREHGGEADVRPRAAADGDVFGASAVTSVENGCFHFFTTKDTKITKDG